MVGSYWPPERRWVESAYRDLPFPFQEIGTPPFQLQLQWDLDSLIGYLSTWSAVQSYKRTTGQDPCPLCGRRWRRAGARRSRPGR